MFDYKHSTVIDSDVKVEVLRYLINCHVLLEANCNFVVTHKQLYCIMYFMKSHKFVRNCLIFQKDF